MATQPLKNAQDPVEAEEERLSPGDEDTVRLPTFTKKELLVAQMETEILEPLEATPLPTLKSARDIPDTPAPKLIGFLEETLKLPRISRREQATTAVKAETLDAVETMELEDAVESELEGDITKPLAAKIVKRPARQLWPKDSWLTLTMLIAYIASIASFWYFFQTHQIVLYGDTYAHMLITRRIFDNATPGLAQLGGVWLPLPHLVMVPFIWNDYLWRTGLAGSIPSMICYQIATVYLFLVARRLTKDSRASFVGSLVFILNPNVLYLQTTALSEIVLIAAFMASAYYFLSWAQEDKLNYLILAGVATFLTTMSRYDGWFLFPIFLVLIVLIGWHKRQARAQIEGNFIIFSTMGGLGMVLWLAWCRLIFGDALYFQRGPFSSQAQQKALIDAHVLFTYHDMWQSIRYYTIDSMENVGSLLFVLGVIAVIVFIFRRRLSPETLAALILLMPFAFYVISLYGGQAALYAPGAVPANFDRPLYNARYGVEVVAPAAVFIATLASSISLNFLRSLGHIVLGGVIIAQTIMTITGGIVSLEDGQFGLSCAHSHTIIIFLAQHYGGGRILEDLYDTKIDALNPEAGIDFRNVVYEGSASLWEKSLRDPASMVNWIIVNPADPHDLVAEHLTPAFNAQFTRDIEEPNGLSLFHRNGLVFPTRPVPSFLLTEHTRCVEPGTTTGSITNPGLNVGVQLIVPSAAREGRTE